LFHRDDLLKTGFLIKTRDGIKSFYQGRIIFPYWKGGKVVYSIARKTEWTPENEFEKSKYKKQLTKKENRQYISDVISNEYFYGIDSIRGKDYCVITEGVTDCIMAMQSGEPCISPVTVRFKSNEIEMVASLVEGMKHVIICNDKDDAGRGGAIDTADILDNNGTNVRIIDLPDIENVDKIDLAEYLKRHDAEEFKALIKNSKPLIVTRLENTYVSNEPLDNIPTATEFIKIRLNGNGTSYKTAFIENHIKKHFGFSSKIISELISEMKADTKKKAIKEKHDTKETQTEEPIITISEDIVEATREIIYTGDPVKKLIETHATLHVGDEPLARALLVSIGIQSVLNSDGIHPKVSGDSGKGKTHCCKAMMHLLPEKYKFNTTLSDRAIYYMDIPDGAVVFSDDIDLSETLEGIIKRSTSNFQEGDNYTTLDKNLDVKELYIPPRISWWLTSVDDDQSIQLLNRQFGGGVDESEKQDNDVFKFQKEKLKTGRAGLPENRDVEICRCILDDIKKQLYTVVVPYADDIDWIDKGNRRNFLIFGDIICAFAILRHRQRYRTEDNELIANIEDYNDAKNLYIGRAKNQGTKLTDAELKFCNLLNGAGELDYSQLQRGMGVSQGRISQIINGKGKGDSGLVNKVPGLIVEKQSVKTDDETTVQKHVCSLHDFNPFDNYETVVTLKEGAEALFLQHYPHITKALPDKNITPLTDITYITKYILYTQELNGNIDSASQNNNVSVITEKQGNKVITPLPTAKEGVITDGNMEGKLPDMPKTAQKQLMKHITDFKRANYSMTDVVDSANFTYEFVQVNPIWKTEATRVKTHVEQLNKQGWK